MRRAVLRFNAKEIWHQIIGGDGLVVTKPPTDMKIVDTYWSGGTDDSWGVEYKYVCVVVESPDLDDIPAGEPLPVIALIFGLEGEMPKGETPSDQTFCPPPPSLCARRAKEAKLGWRYVDYWQAPLRTT